MDNEFDAVILSACRTPIGAFGGALKEVSAVGLGAIVIREAIARAGVPVTDIGDAVMGCVLQAGNGMNVARQAALKAGLPIDVPGEGVSIPPSKAATLRRRLRPVKTTSNASRKLRT